MPLHNENLFLNKMNIYEGYYHDFLAWICQCIVKYLLHGHVRLLQMAFTCIYIGVVVVDLYFVYFILI
jgi:hypothetical protein